MSDESPIVLPDDPSFGDDVQVDYPGYRSTRLRAPKRPLVTLPEELHVAGGPVFGDETVSELDYDLTRQHEGEPLGERIIVAGRVLDDTGKPIRNALVEVWQANSAGRYKHQVDQHPAPLDPNFSGAGRCLTDDDGNYRFISVKPGAYPWGNHENAWRPAHIHFSVFGRAFAQRLVTQMYFPGDPLVPVRPDLQLGARPEGTRPARLGVRSRLDAARVGARLSLGHRARSRRQRHDAARGGRMNRGAHALADGRSVLRDRALPAGRERARARRASPARSA